MFEFKIKNLPKEKLSLLEDISIFPIENNFNNETYYTLYGDKDTENILNEINILFEKENIESSGWENKWKEYLKPGNLTDTIKYVFDSNLKDSKSILINPAMAFGTGTHSTTQIAARLLEFVVENKNVVDVGCGSGILSIASEILNADKVVAIDIDFRALLNAKENFFANDCKNVDFWVGELNSVNLRFKPDIICANIISSVLLKIKEDIFNFKPKYIVVSGILVNEIKKFRQEFIPVEYRVLKYLELNEWCGLLLVDESS